MILSRLFAPAIATALAVPALLPVSASAASPAEIERLWALIDMPEVIAVMRTEGIDYGKSLDEDMLEGRGGYRFSARVEAIYDAARMEAETRATFETALGGVDIGPALEFFSGEVGAKALAAELEARKAMLEPEVDRAARQAAEDLVEEDPARFHLITRFAEVNDLFESNVVGALNANYAFLRGMGSTGVLGPEMDESAMLQEVWAQEGQVRADTESWVLGFLTLSYQSLTEDELSAYVAFSESPAGLALNREIMVAFDRMFLNISHQLGVAVGEELSGEDL